MLSQIPFLTGGKSGEGGSWKKKKKKAKKKSQRIDKREGALGFPEQSIVLPSYKKNTGYRLWKWLPRPQCRAASSLSPFPLTVSFLFFSFHAILYIWSSYNCFLFIINIFSLCFFMFLLIFSCIFIFYLYIRHQYSFMIIKFKNLKNKNYLLEERRGGGSRNKKVVFFF